MLGLSVIPILPYIDKKLSNWLRLSKKGTPVVIRGFKPLRGTFIHDLRQIPSQAKYICAGLPIGRLLVAVFQAARYSPIREVRLENQERNEYGW